MIYTKLSNLILKSTLHLASIIEVTSYLNWFNIDEYCKYEFTFVLPMFLSIHIEFNNFLTLSNIYIALNSNIIIKKFECTDYHELSNLNYIYIPLIL